MLVYKAHQHAKYADLGGLHVPQEIFEIRHSLDEI